MDGNVMDSGLWDVRSVFGLLLWGGCLLGGDGREGVLSFSWSGRVLVLIPCWLVYVLGSFVRYPHSVVWFLLDAWRF